MATLTWRETGRRPGHAEVFAAIAALSFLVARFVPVLELGIGCPFRALTGIPCASCGMTHAFVHLAHGELRLSLSSSPLGALLAGGAWLYALADLLRLALGAPLPIPGQSVLRTATALGVVALFANWAYLVSVAA